METQPCVGERHAQLKAANAITGGLSRTTKMPCHSWGLPATSCKTGSRLATIEDTVCSSCYARKGLYYLPRVQAANQRRLAQEDHPDWVDAMATLINWQATKNGEPFFRWFDSGDLQSEQMLERIVAVTRATTTVQHWLPTKEHGMVKEYLALRELPDNLSLRVSAYIIDGPPPALLGLPTSTVHSNEPGHGYVCPAYNEQPATCGPCRTCWDPTVGNVSYARH